MIRFQERCGNKGQKCDHGVQLEVRAVLNDLLIVQRGQQDSISWLRVTQIRSGPVVGELLLGGVEVLCVT